MTDRTGQQLGNYRLLRLLGRGGFATVYLGEHIHLNTLAAIKVLDTRLSSDGIDQFREEARTIARLEHPNIVRVLDFGVEETTPFLVMGYAPNGTLRQLYPTGTRMPPSLCRFQPDISPAMEAVVLRALVKDPHQRFATVQDFADALEQAYSTGLLPGGVTSPLVSATHDETSSEDAIHRVSTRTERTQTPAIHAVAWSPDRRRIASGGHDRTVRVWDVKTALVSLIYRGHVAGVTTLAWSPDGQRIASASLDKTVQVWDATNGQKIASYDGHSGMIHTVAWSPHGQSIASASGGGQDKAVQLWNALTGRHSYTYPHHTYWVRAVAWSPNGKWLASGSLKEVQVWNAANGQKVSTFHGHEGWVRALAWSPDGKRIVSTGEDKAVQVWEVTRGHLIATFRGHNEWVSSIAWSSDGKHIVSVSKDALVQVWDVEHQQHTSSSRTSSHGLTFHAHPSSTHAVVWLPDDKHIASASGDGSVQVWQAV